MLIDQMQFTGSDILKLGAKQAVVSEIGDADNTFEEITVMIRGRNE